MVSKKLMKTPVSMFHSKANDFSLVIFSRVWMQYGIKVDFFSRYKSSYFLCWK